MNHKSIPKTTLGLWLSVVVAGTLAYVLITPFLVQMPSALLSLGIPRNLVTIIILVAGIVSIIGGVIFYRVSESRMRRNFGASSILLIAMATTLMLEGMMTVIISLLSRG